MHSDAYISSGDMENLEKWNFWSRSFQSLNEIRFPVGSFQPFKTHLICVTGVLTIFLVWCFVNSHCFLLIILNLSLYAPRRIESHTCTSKVRRASGFVCMWPCTEWLCSLALPLPPQVGWGLAGWEGWGHRMRECGDGSSHRCWEEA